MNRAEWRRAQVARRRNLPRAELWAEQVTARSDLWADLMYLRSRALRRFAVEGRDYMHRDYLREDVTHWFRAHLLGARWGA